METRARYILMGLFTLAVIAAGFGFVYWLHATGGLGSRAVYRIRFDGSASGLRAGSAVLFNGIRVGEVTGLRLDPASPRQVAATIAVERNTPIRTDTRVGVASQGLTGAAVVSLQGGAPTAPAPTGASGEPATLVADPSATQDMTQTAREVLRHIDSVLADNAEPLHSTISNLSTFSGALARNSDRLDGIMAGLERLTGGGPAKPSGPVYHLRAVTSFPASEKALAGPIVIAEPTAVVVFDTQKILVQPKAGQTRVLDEGQWGDSLPKLFQAKVIQSFENANYLQSVARPTEGLAADRQLLIDIRSFQITLSPEPAADVEFAAKILADGRIAHARLFHKAVPIKATDAAASAAGLDEAFGQAVTDLVLWAAEAL